MRFRTGRHISMPLMFTLTLMNAQTYIPSISCLVCSVVHNWLGDQLIHLFTNYLFSSCTVLGIDFRDSICITPFSSSPISPLRGISHCRESSTEDASLGFHSLEQNSSVVIAILRIKSKLLSVKYKRLRNLATASRPASQPSPCISTNSVNFQPPWPIMFPLLEYLTCIVSPNSHISLKCQLDIPFSRIPSPHGEGVGSTLCPSPLHNTWTFP